MKALIKGIISLLVAGLLLFTIAIVGILVFVDPNDYRPELEILAAEQGIHLEMEGNIGWQFFPSLSLNINQVAVANSSAPEKPIASIGSLTASVRVLPLLKRQIQIAAIRLNDAEVMLEINDTGRGNWEDLIDGLANAPDDHSANNKQTLPQQHEAEPQESSSNLKLDLKALDISRAKLVYTDAQAKQTFSVENLNLSSKRLNLANRPFPLSLELDLKSSELAEAMNISWSGEFTINAAADQLKLSNGLLSIKSAGPANAQMVVDLNASASRQGAWQYHAGFELQKLNIKQWLTALNIDTPETANPSALKQFSLKGQLNGGAISATLEPLSIALDNTTFTGNARFKDLNTGAFSLQLEGDKIRLDDYLPPETAEAAETTNTDKTSTPETNKIAQTPTGNSEPLLPLDSLKALNFDATVQLQNLEVMDLTLSSINLKAKAKQGLITLETLHADFYEGDIDIQAQLNAQGKTAKINQTLDIKSVQIEKLLAALSPPGNEKKSSTTFSGSINAQLTAETQGNTTEEFTKALLADLSLNTKELKLSPLNLEQSFCEAASLLSRDSQTSTSANGTTEPTQWPAFTQLQDLNGSLTIRDQRLAINTLTAGLENLLLSTEGFVDLKKNRYQLTLPMTLQGESSSDDGCRIKNKFVRNRELSFMKCEGPFQPLNAKKDCGLDEKAMSELLTQYAKYKGKEKIAGQKDKLINKAKEKFGEDAGRLLDSLFKR